MTQYIALLRGINLGKRRIKMDTLRADFEAWGFASPRTVLASGNVVFESGESDPARVQAAIEAGFQSKYGWEVLTCARTGQEIRELVAGDPFDGTTDSKDFQRYVTFLAEAPKTALHLPHISADGNYRILDVQAGHVVSVLDRRQGHGTLDAMAVLEELFGSNITTRNWNTVLKIHELLGTG